MFKSLKSRLWLSNTAVIAVTIVLIVLFINLFAVSAFNIYKVKDLEKTYDDIYNVFSAQYQNNHFDLWLFNESGTDILENRNVFIVLQDSAGRVLYDSGEALSQPPQRYNEKSYDILDNGVFVGRLLLSSVEHYDANELSFISRIIKAVIIIGLVAMGFTFLVSNVLAGRISKPISNITKIAGDIASGQYGEKAHEKTGITEIQNLMLAINNLSDNLESHEKLRKRLTQNVAHELRTPIATMQGNLEAVLDGVWEMDHDKVAFFYNEVLRLSRLVSDLNQLSKYENTVLSKTTFDLCKLLQYVLKNFESDLREKNIQIDMQAESISLYADKDKLTQVFMNLLANAVKFTPADGNIHINAAADEKEVTVSIRDSGKGVNMEDLPHIFERFYRADPSRNRESGGAGIGLSIVKAVTEAHNGTVKAFSEPGQGAEFIVCLPLPE